MNVCAAINIMACAALIARRVVLMNSSAGASMDVLSAWKMLLLTQL